MEIEMPYPLNRAKTQFGETASNLFHAAIALGFGLVTAAAVLHVALGLA
jgi:hypothetical protein